jgi:two-component system, NarL family, sensor kinase
MNGRLHEDGVAALAMAILRATLVVVILVSEQLVAGRRLASGDFFVVLGLATAYAVAGIVVAVGAFEGPSARALVKLQPGCDVLFLTALAYTSGGAFSDVRKAFFVIPLAAAFSERPRSTANWSLLAVTVFTLQAVLARGHPAGVQNDWQRMAVNQGLYLAWTGAAATMLAVGLRRRSAHTNELAHSRQRLVTQAIASVERERTRLAGALHDSPVQNLIAARHDLRRAEQSGDPDSFVRLREAIDLTIAELREEIFNLHPHVLDHVGLSAALEQVARRHALDGDLRITVEVDPRTDSVHRQVLFALGRELLGNAAKHARASEIRLSVTHNSDAVALMVADNGCGIPDGRMQQALVHGHIGLAAVTERVAALGGTIGVTTARGRGTSILITLPTTPGEEPSDEAVRAGWVRREISDRVTSGDTLRVSTT